MPTKSIITACDKNQEYLLLWWVKNIRKNVSPDTIICVFDMGISLTVRHKLVTEGVYVETHEPLEGVHPWFNKPFCLEKTKTDQTLWLDTDCEVVNNIDDIWENGGDYLLLANDPVIGEMGKPLTANTGVILYNNHLNCTNAINIWKTGCLDTDLRGDQDVLESLLPNEFIKTHLDQKYNWLRLLTFRGKHHKDARIMHWTGPVGKEHIKNKLIPRQIALESPGLTNLGHNYTPTGVERMSDE